MSDPFDLQRFVDAQAGVYADVCDELRDGRKRGHWIWFVFPQLRGLGRSPTAAHYGIASAQEARAYLAHPTFWGRGCGNAPGWLRRSTGGQPSRSSAGRTG